MVEHNRPKAGDAIRVDPIRELKNVKLIKKLLADRPRDLAIFTLGINTNLRASDILRITIGHVRHLGPEEHFVIREKKTGKEKAITINKTVHAAIRQLIQTLPADTPDETPLFRSRKGDAKALTVSYLHKLVKGWCREINLVGNYGSHTLRKTFGYMHRVVNHTDLPTLMQMFNHSTQRQTLSYLGIQAEEIKSAYLFEL